MVDLQPNSQFGKYSELSVIDRISDTITKEHKDALLEKLSNDKVLQMAFENNNTVSVLEKIATVIPKDGAYFKDSLSKVLARDIHYIEKKGRFNYVAHFGNSEVDDKISVPITEEQVADLGVIKAVGRDIEKKAEFISTKGAAYDVPNSSEKLIIMNVDGMRKYAYANDIDTSSTEACKSIFTGEMPQVGDYGVWTHDNQASIPFEITSMIKSAQLYEITGFDGATATSYMPVRSVEEPTPHESMEHCEYIPASYRFVKIGEHTELDRTDPNKEELTPHYYVRDDVNLYSLRGPVFTKFAQLGHAIDSLELPDASWAALQCQASAIMIEKMAAAPTNIRIPFESVLKAPKGLDKVANMLENEYEAYAKCVRNVAQDLIKEAATLADPTSVDAVLSLNMITKENVLEFVHQLPLFEQVLSYLAQMLLTVRTGFSSVPEMAVVRSMKGLAKVVEILRGMQKLEKVKTR
jgi:hypothetical protein